MDIKPHRPHHSEAAGHAHQPHHQATHPESAAPQVHHFQEPDPAEKQAWTPARSGYNKLAIASLVAAFVFAPFGSIAAIVLGLMAKRQIDDSHGKESGMGFAWAGMIFGALGVFASGVRLIGGDASQVGPIVGTAIGVVLVGGLAYVFFTQVKDARVQGLLNNRKQIITFVLGIAAVVIILMLQPVVGNGLASLISGTNTCKGFMDADPQTRASVIAKLYKERYPHGSSMGAANALMNAEYVCEYSPDKKLSDINF